MKFALVLLGIVLGVGLTIFLINKVTLDVLRNRR